MAPRARARQRTPASTQAPRTRPWTRADLLRLPDDGNRYEVLDGCLLVTPQASYPHQVVALRLAMMLEAYVSAGSMAHVVGPGAVPFKKNELQPDVQVIPGKRVADGKWTTVPAPILVVEVLSAATRHRDFGIKLDAYLERVKVPVVWIVDHHAREVHVAVRGEEPRAERETLTWHPEGVTAGTLAPLRISLPEFFREALGA